MENEGYYVLAISIIANVTPEQAFVMYSTGHKPRVVLDKRDELVILALKQKGHTNEAIGQLFGLSQFALSKKVHRIAKDYGIAI